MTINEALFILKHGSSNGVTTYLQAIEVVENLVANALATDAVEVVRCKDCKHLLQDLSERKAHICMQNPFARRNVNLDDFCSNGERFKE